MGSKLQASGNKWQIREIDIGCQNTIKNSNSFCRNRMIKNITGKWTNRL